MAGTTTSAVVMELVAIQQAVPTVAEHFQWVVPMVAERSHAADLMAGVAFPFTSDASSAVAPRLRSRDWISFVSQYYLTQGSSR